MNLKAAAHALEVHYQTAYKWVRSGALSAVRVGGRYEVSQAAIDQFRSTRRALVADPRTPPTRRTHAVTCEDVLEEFEAMMTDTVIGVASVAALAARRGAQAIGDLCLVGIVDRVPMTDDLTVERLAIDHPEPDHAAFLSALIGTLGPHPTLRHHALTSSFTSGHTVRIPHAPQDKVRAALRPDLRQYLTDYPMYSLLAAPILAKGAPVGFLVFARDTPSRPYTEADERYAGRLGEHVGALIRNARDAETAWRLRQDLADVVQAHFTGARPDAGPTGAKLDSWMFADLGAAVTLPVAVLDADGTWLTANEPFQEASGYPRAALAGKSLFDLTHPDDREAERANFERLTCGELDFMDQHARLLRADGTVVHEACHRVAIRRPDATLACVITVRRPLHLPVVSVGPEARRVEDKPRQRQSVG